MRITDDEPVPVADASGVPALRPRLTVSPNPAPGGRLTVGFDVTGESGEVDVAIFGVTGTRIRSLLVGAAPEVGGRVEWDGRGDHGVPVPAGTYFARARDGNGGSATRRVIVIP